MASLSFTHFLSLPRGHSTCPNYQTVNFVQLQAFRLQNKWGLAAISRKKISETLPGEEEPNENGVVLKKTTTRKTKRATSRTRKKASDKPEDNSELVMNFDAENGENSVSPVSEDSKQTPRRTRRKATSAIGTVEEEKTEKKVRKRRKTKKMDEDVEYQGSESEVSDSEESAFLPPVENESDGEQELEKDDGEDVSCTYGWPPLVCCFGAAQHAFVPSGRPANRLLNYEIHERMKDAYWAPEKFVRAPGGSAGSVAIALANLGGKVAFMGKLGDDEYGQSMLYYMNVNNVQTRSVQTDSKRATAASHMKIAKRGRLRTTCARPCAEDSLSKSEINIDVLKEAKMLYFNTHSLIDRNMRSATMRAIRISKKLGGVIFYDVNLPLPLWHSSEETKLFIQEVWNHANIIEVTKQELEFLCGIEPTEEFDTKDNASSKFVHYGPEVVAPLWHENLKVLFVTNGTSKIHYYTEEFNGSVHGMEDPAITPFTCDMSASGDGIVAAIMRMLSVQPHLIADKGYLEKTIKYAIDCGVIDQWLLGRMRGFPPKEDMEDEVEPDPNGIRSITEKEYRTLEYHTWSQ
ncbi:fructokinase-like 2, chloroplastic [Ricinus communis]|uniref:Fructokinase, putative n=1 Tax=Ricinus communis TaxID=3988 RepID=B9REC2_RICCO|nr:fructokinase-like 2, chloroplastic [Ricinus communis]EEF50730.1 fructokinase, putative [Ricinus communis]|eukprot:XP_015584294.1 fructokinase-like 2, chloroplastic [Ricinus communis]